jgi:hypothetical protein
MEVRRKHQMTLSWAAHEARAKVLQSMCTRRRMALRTAGSKMTPSGSARVARRDTPNRWRSSMRHLGSDGRSRYLACATGIKKSGIVENVECWWS